MVRIKRAIISVYNKKGIVEFAKGLISNGVEILATEGTYKFLQDRRISVLSVSEYLSYPHLLGGRVKTLHPKIYAGLLALEEKEHREEIRKNNILLLNMVVVNLYPFAEKANNRRGLREVLENIDIGGVSLLRAGAKNIERVAVVSSPSQYREILEEMQRNKGCLSEDTIRTLALEAFWQTSEYDRTIFKYLSTYFSSPKKEDLPETIELRLRKIRELRYGENPHQKAGLYKTSEPKTFAEIEQLQGKELSYNNLADADVAYKLVKEFDRPAVAIIKHQSPAGVAVNRSLSSAFQDALRCDEVSAFGGIVGFNRRVDEGIAREVLKAGFLECFIAPSYTAKALALLAERKNLRLLRIDKKKQERDWEFKRTWGGILVQEEDESSESPRQWRRVSRKEVSEKEREALLFAWKVAKYVKSNAIVLAKRGNEGFATVGIGGGQTSRIEAVKIALSKAGERAKGAVLASDGFFPFPDSVDLAGEKGVKAIVQPGGSLRDKEVIQAVDRAKMSMLFTGVRHFKH
ncbi:MAG: bifunctional phosphoribosylaminoimidazolecarboxamide formyltransferase/inosine monophosphate cyclohydrolase [Candidatus Omnitrophota bacterium]|nr:MAG: bifunctional phosphoribosylaminoimidazolecarboxamide formyltransferase/inosine monophosphate cyclohydrolase [Candidatus Omnitrophota bacterium]